MRVVALTGAGISKAAGIPTFEEIDGIQEKLSLNFKEQYPKELQDRIKVI